MEPEGLVTKSSPRGVLFALAVITLTALALRMFRLSHPSFWNDEYATYVFATEPFSRIFSSEYAAETNPPLYYLIQKAWLLLGDSREFMRMLSVFFGVLAIPLTYLVGRPLLGDGPSLIACGLVATSEIHIHYSREIRCYSLLIAASLGALACLLRIFAAGGVIVSIPPNSPPIGSSIRRSILLWAGYGSCSLVALYAHSTAILLPVLGLGLVAGLVLAARAPRRLLVTFLAVNSLVGILYLPWLLVLANQSRRVLPNFWIPPSTFSWIYSNVLGTYPYPKWAKPIMWGFLLLGGWSLRKHRAGAFLLAFVVGQPFVLWLTSQFQHVFIVRAMLWPTPLGFLVMAWGFYQLLPWLGGRGVAMVTFVACALQLWDARQAFPVQREDRSSVLVKALSDYRAESDILVFAPISTAWALWYEGRKLAIPRSGIGVTYGDRPLQLEQWYGAHRILRSEIKNNLADAQRAWLLIERKPMTASKAGEGFEQLPESLAAWGNLVQVWDCGTDDLKLYQRNRPVLDAPPKALQHE